MHLILKSFAVLTNFRQTKARFFLFDNNRIKKKHKLQNLYGFLISFANLITSGFCMRKENKKKIRREWEYIHRSQNIYVIFIIWCKEGDRAFIDIKMEFGFSVFFFSFLLYRLTTAVLQSNQIQSLFVVYFELTIWQCI